MTTTQIRSAARIEFDTLITTGTDAHILEGISRLIATTDAAEVRVLASLTAEAMKRGLI